MKGNFMERVEREKFCVINVKYKEISWRVRKRRRRKKVTSRSTEELVLKNKAKWDNNTILAKTILINLCTALCMCSKLSMQCWQQCDPILFLLFPEQYYYIYEAYTSLYILTIPFYDMSRNCHHKVYTICNNFSLS